MIKRLALLFLSVFCISTLTYGIDAWIRINQLGYLPNSQKKAVFISESPQLIKQFALFDALTDEKIAVFHTVVEWGEFQSYKSVYTLDFSTFNHQGAFYIKAGLVYSPSIFINKNIYLGSADYLLNYMRQQRCGFNPALNEVCHQNESFEVYGLEQTQIIISEATKKTSKKSVQNVPDQVFVDVRGGWHQASGYFQYGSTTASAVFQLLFAYQMNPTVFSDTHDSDGKAGSNGVPDVLDEAKWGLDWMLKMYPDNEVLYHQIGDDRDQALSQLPSEDRIDYGFGVGASRPVFLATGKPQGLLKYKNHSTGIASIAGKYASAFALGAGLLGKFYPKFAETLKTKALAVYEYGQKNPGVCQTVPGKLPYCQEEENWSDDMELAATQLYGMTYNGEYLKQAAAYGRMEPVTPWMCSDTARHYQWYPFLNLGHYMLANVENPRYHKEFLQNLLNGIQRVNLHANENPFNVGIPLIRSSNNLVVAMATQCKLYRSITNDSTYINMETSLVDWLFGCNPWGTSMVVGLPAIGDTPANPHSSLSHFDKILPSGGLINGPVHQNIFKNLLGSVASKNDVYERFQTDWAVYHDGYSDFSTNEPTLDGTTALSFLLAVKQQEGVPGKMVDNNEYSYGGVIRTNRTKKQISLVFAGHEFADGNKIIRKTLKKLNIKASFFFTGDFYKNPKFDNLIKGLQKDGHYLGAHSNRNLLYCSLQNRDSLLVSKSVFLTDLKANYRAMARFGINKNETPFFLPPNEWYNDSISRWSKEVGLNLVSYTPGTLSSTDNSIPEMRDNYFSSIEIYNRIIQVENKQSLNGNILLFHIGADSRRQDKFYPRLYSLLLELSRAGYDFIDLYKATDLIDENASITPDKKQKRKNIQFFLF